MDWHTIENSISHALGIDFAVRSAQTVGGGCINEAVCLEGASRRFFVKLNQAGVEDMFAAEAVGLEAIRETGAILVPTPICSGSDQEHSWLVMDFVDLASPSQNTSALLGEQLAAMHRHTSTTFGFRRDNYIGSTQQPNKTGVDWVSFFTHQRIGLQLNLARRNGAPTKLFDSGQCMLEGLAAFFDTYQPVPSLLHGDLWSGNRGCTSAGEPAIFDPAVYFGDREADLAMTELFGGFDDRFYQSYRQSWALDPGYKTRKVLYNLYHILNHYNLFGGGYAGQAQSMIDHLLAELS
jgi:protein-ribulosamine 3-kinase